MTIVALSYPPTIYPTRVGFARTIVYTGTVVGLIFWPMLRDVLKTEAFYRSAIVPSLGFLIYVLINWEPLGVNVDVEDAKVLAELRK